MSSYIQLMVFLFFSFSLFILTKLSKKFIFFARNAFALSFLTSVFFLLHPVQTQTVSYVIQGQLEGLAALFSLSIVFCFLLFNSAQTRWLRISALVLFFFLAILSCGTKEIAIVTPLLVLLVDWFFIAHGSWQSLQNRLLIHFGNVITVLGIYIYLLKPKFFINIFSFNMEVGNNIGNIITESSHQAITPYYFFIHNSKLFFIISGYLSGLLILVLNMMKCSLKVFFLPIAFFPFLTLAAIGFILYKLLQQNSTSIIGFAALWFISNITPRSSIVPSPDTSC